MVYNIRSEFALSISKQRFVVDTNALYWTFYSKCTYSNRSPQKEYPNALTTLKSKNNVLYTPNTCIYELLSIIEKNEYELYCARKRLDKEIFHLKDYRGIAAERESVAKELDITYKTLKTVVNITDQIITRKNIDDVLLNYTKHCLDVYDKALVDYCEQQGIQYIITDDRDYMSLNGNINIFTANEKYFKNN